MQYSLLLALKTSILLFVLNIAAAQHVSEFVSLPGGNQNSQFVHPPTHTFQYIIEEGQALTTGGTMSDRFDFTGYVAINGSSQNGYLSISHEDSPGGVTILDVQFDSTKKSWGHSASQAVDFTGVAGTRRNCSGTVTPWGTIVTSEEATDPDNNNDGYKDVGWNVEIDPVTKTIVDYPGGLVGVDKMWALGNFKHENIVVHPNQRTVYQAEDSSTGNLFKFVCNVAGNFNAGNLYVYVGPKSGSGNWVQLNNNTPTQQNSTVSQADAVSATNFDGAEDIEINPLDNSVYFAVKNEDKVYRFVDNSPLTGGVVSSFSTYVGDMTYSFMTSNGIQSEAWGNGNDNLVFDNLGNLWVCNDGANDHIWVVDNGHTQSNPKVRIFGKSPAGSEPTGMTFSPDNKYIFMSFQHPSSSNVVSVQDDAFSQPRRFNKDVAIVIARKENLGNCHKDRISSGIVNSSQILHAAEDITSTSLLINNANIEYLAGECITLPIGFETSIGTQFLADIIGCTVNTP